MSKVLICRGKNYCLEALLDEEDYEWAVEQGNWFVTHGARLEDRQGSMTSGYAVRSVWKKDRWGLLWLHKEILLRSVGPHPCPKHHIGDHLNGNRLDNRRSNLRWATYQMNSRNKFGFADKQMELFNGHVHSN